MVVGIVTAAVLGTIGLSAADEAAHPPEAKVEEYLDALIDGRASDALALGGVDSDVDIFDADPALLSDEVFGAAKNRITSYEILDVTRDDDQDATVTAEIDQGGSKHTMQFEVSSIGGDSPSGDRWKLDAQEQAFLHVLISPSIDRVLVNGVDLTLDPSPASRGLVLPALPGGYEFSVPESNPWLTVPPVSVTVDAGNIDLLLQTVDLHKIPTPALTDAVDRQINAYLAECLASTSLRPENCPNTVDERDPDQGEVVWHLEAPPRYSLEVGTDDAVRVRGTESGIATAAASDPGNDRASSLKINGTIEIDGDVVTFVPEGPF